MQAKILCDTLQRPTQPQSIFISYLCSITTGLSQKNKLCQLVAGKYLTALKYIQTFLLFFFFFEYRNPENTRNEDFLLKSLISKCNGRAKGYHLLFTSILSISLKFQVAFCLFCHQVVRDRRKANKQVNSPANSELIPTGLSKHQLSGAGKKRAEDSANEQAQAPVVYKSSWLFL